MSILQDIFKEHYEEMIYILHPRESVIENVDKMIDCGNPEHGGAYYTCPKCSALKFVPFRCHSRFCPTCGNKYSIDRTTSMSFKILNCSHRHCTFTIAEELRPFFLKDRRLLGCLFSSVSSVIMRMFHKDNKSEQFTPGFICVLHTFGRDLKWNPHIHCLVSEGGLGNSGSWRIKRHFNYTYLRYAFQTALLNELENHLGSSFKKVKAAIYRNHNNGFYVHAEPRKCNPKIVSKYIGRYLGRPVIANSRIDKYDGENVTFHYNRHEDNKYVKETIPALEFIERLIQHIPEKHFKQIRYYGLYARHRKCDENLIHAIPDEKHDLLLSFNKWRIALARFFNADPLECPNCGTTMKFECLCFNNKPVTLYEIYEKVMHKAKGCRSPVLT